MIVPAGYISAISLTRKFTLQILYYTDGKHVLTENATFVFKTVEAQRFIAVKYISEDDFNRYTGNWTVDIMAMNYNELPTILEKQKYAPDNIYYQFFVVTLDGNKNVMGNEYLSKYDLYMTGTYGYETGKDEDGEVLYKYQLITSPKNCHVQRY